MPRNPMVQLLICAAVDRLGALPALSPRPARRRAPAVVVILQWFAVIGATLGAIGAIYQLATGAQPGAKERQSHDRKSALETPPRRLDLGGLGAGRSARPAQFVRPAEKVKQGVAEVREGKTFCLSLPLDYPGGTVVNARRHPPRLIANKREGMPYIAYPLARENPQFVDVICDDVVEMTLQYSTQWDSLPHVGQLFDADGDGVPEMVCYNGYRAGDLIIGPVDYRDGGAVERGEHVGALKLGIDNLAAHPVQGARRDDRPRIIIAAAAKNLSATTA